MPFRTWEDSSVSEVCAFMWPELQALGRQRQVDPVIKKKKMQCTKKQNMSHRSPVKSIPWEINHESVVVRELLKDCSCKLRSSLPHRGKSDRGGGIEQSQEWQCYWKMKKLKDFPFLDPLGLWGKPSINHLLKLENPLASSHSPSWLVKHPECICGMNG